VPKEGMVLADIYNYNELGFSVNKEIKQIGFNKSISQLN
jgi:hypothetical protein